MFPIEKRGIAGKQVSSVGAEVDDRPEEHQAAVEALATGMSRHWKRKVRWVILAVFRDSCPERQ